MLRNIIDRLISWYTVRKCRVGDVIVIESKLLKTFSYVFITNIHGDGISGYEVNVGCNTLNAVTRSVGDYTEPEYAPRITNGSNVIRILDIQVPLRKELVEEILLFDAKNSVKRMIYRVQLLKECITANGKVLNDHHSITEFKNVFQFLKPIEHFGNLDKAMISLNIAITVTKLDILEKAVRSFTTDDI